MPRRTWLILAVVLLGNLGCWAWINRPQDEIAFNGVIRGVSFSPYGPDHDPLENRFPTADDIDRDLQVVASRVARVRTYSSIDGMEQIPRLAKKYGLKVTAGAWLDTRKERNERELRNLVRTARTQGNV